MRTTDPVVLGSFQFYRENTGGDLRGCVDATFWNTDLLILSHASKYLEHFVVSMSSLDEAYRLRTTPDRNDVAQQRYAFSLRQYQQGLEGFLGDIVQPRKIEVVLAACLVCIAMELWHGDVVNATHHVVAGGKIACEYMLSEIQSSPPNSIMQSLLASLWRYHTQLRPGNPKALLLLQCRVQTASDSGPSHFYELLDQYLVYTDGLPHGQLKGAAIRFLEQIKSWYHDVYIAQKSPKRSREHHLFASHYHAIQAMTIAFVTDDEMEFDEHLEDFQQTLTHCSAFLKLDRSSQGITSARRAPDATVNMALLLVAAKCRVPSIRRQAIRRLCRARRLEGIWSSIMIGVLAEQLMTLEERGERGPISPTAVLVPPENRRAFNSFRYEPRILASAGNAAVMSSWAQDPPQLTLEFSRSNGSSCTVDSLTIHMKPYIGNGEFGMKSVFWWPMTDPSTLLAEEVPESTKSLDGPHMGYHPFSGSVNTDLRSLLYMRFLYLDVDTPKRSEACSLKGAASSSPPNRLASTR